MTKADRDAEGKIRVTPPERHLADLLPPTPAQAAPAEEATRHVRLGRLELAGSVLGLMLALALIVLIERALPARQEVRAPVVAPPLPAPTRAQPTPTRVPSATPAPSTTAVSPTPTLEPPTPIVIVVPAPPPIQCYTVRIDVSDEHGTPIGIAEGYSCESQAAAQANAEAQADQVRQAHTQGGRP